VMAERGLLLCLGGVCEIVSNIGDRENFSFFYRQLVAREPIWFFLKKILQFMRRRV
jgi:hypothetical protein